MTWNHLPTSLFSSVCFRLAVVRKALSVSSASWLFFLHFWCFVWTVLPENTFILFASSVSIFSFFFDNSLPASDLLLIPADSFFPLCWFSWDVGEDWALWSAGFNDNEKHQFYSRLSWKLNVRGLASVLFLKLRTTTTAAKEGTVATTIKTKADTTTE